MKSAWPIVICVLLAVDAAALWFWMESRAELKIDPLVHEAAMKYQVQPALIKAVIWKESRFNPDARGLAGEIGLMQIMKDAASDWSKAENIAPFHHEHLTHSGSNTMAGTWYLRKALERYTDADNCLPYALAEYNAGRSNVLRWNKGAAATNSRLFIKQIDFPFTKSYVLSVMTRYAEYLPEYGISTRSRVETVGAD